MPIRLCYFDVDETLLDEQRRIVPVLEEALAACRARGIGLGLATGRMYEAALPHARSLRASAPLILCNGARVQAPDSGKVLLERTLDLEDARRALELIARRGLHVNLYLDDAIYIERESATSLESASKDGVRQRVVGNLVAFLDRPPTKLLVIGTWPDLRDLREAFDGQPHSTNLVRSEPTYLEFLPADTTKGSALEAVAGITGVPLCDIAAFGDSNNDIEMLEAAGIGVAVANALDATKRAADHVCRLPRGEGVAEALRELVLG